MECFGPGLTRLPDHFRRQPPECQAAVVSQSLPDLLRRLLDTLPRARHGVQIRRVSVFPAQHVLGPGLQLAAFLAPGAACGKVRIEPAGLDLRQVRRPPRRDAGGQSAHFGSVANLT